MLRLIIPRDLLVQVGEINFYSHKYLLLSRSGKFNPMIYEARDLELCKVVLDDLPGGPESFELAAKFCYGIAVDLTAANISGLRCMAKMAEDLEEGNLIFKTWAENTGKTPKVSSPKWNGDVKESSPSRNVQVPPDWWFEDVSILRIDHFVRVITAIKVKGMKLGLNREKVERHDPLSPMS
ncbi:hypothetical protein MLD38_014543 [Melastoma candidum]|uniref:Uncharacterized protein n=1 Tax=Melastoma candidum TaxID=119954 RepID=A0ACB9RD24_9MYRT|nr:hypothetical protein MLD38_014543 [Melastoma candidum]